jgi:hypothetical protein
VTAPAVVFHCQACGAEVGYMHGADDGVLLAGRERTTKAADDNAKRTRVGKRRHHHETWMGSEFMLRGEGYATRDPEAWCPGDGRVTLPDRERLLAHFHKAIGERRTVHARVPPIG